MNVIDFMIQREQDGLRLYELLGHETADPRVKEIFELLADRQRVHLGALEALKENVDPADADSMLAERTQHVGNGFRQLLDSPDILRQLKNDPDAFVHIVKAEDESIQLLEGMAKAESRENIRTLLESMAEEEKGHLVNIENIYDFMETPRTFLEWGEFSNLHPL